MTRKNCTAISYNCGSICLSLQKNCRVGGEAIGKDRLSKVMGLAKSLAGGVPDARKGIGRLGTKELDKLASRIKMERSAKAEMLRRGRSKAIRDGVELQYLKEANDELSRLLKTGKEEDGSSIDEETAEAVTRHLGRVQERIKTLGGEIPEPVPKFKALRTELVGSKKQVAWAETIRDDHYRGAKSELERIEEVGVDGISNLSHEDFKVMQSYVIDAVNKISSASEWIDSRYRDTGRRLAKDAVTRYAEDMALWGDQRLTPEMGQKLVDRAEERNSQARKQEDAARRYSQIERPELIAASKKQKNYADEVRERRLAEAQKKGVNPEHIEKAHQLLPELRTARWWLDDGNIDRAVKNMLEKTKVV